MPAGVGVTGDLDGVAGGTLTEAGVWGQGSKGGWQEGIIATMATVSGVCQLQP